MSDKSISAPITVPARSVATIKEQVSPKRRIGDLPPCASDDVSCLQHETKYNAPFIDLFESPPVPQGHSDAVPAPASDLKPPGNAQAPDHGMDSILLTKVAYLRRLQRYHGRKRIQAEQRLQIRRTSWTIRDRLIRGKKRLIGELSKAVHLENPKAFLPLFQAFHTTDAACDEYDKIDCHLPSDGDWDSSTGGSHNVPFLDRLPDSSCDVLLQFLRNLSCDPHFLLRHLSCLSNKDFEALLQQCSSSASSVLRGEGPSHSIGYRDKSSHGFLDTFLDLDRHDFISLLMNLVGIACPGGVPGHRSTRYWAKVCAALLSKQKPGSEKFVVAVMNTWPMREGSGTSFILENWFLEVLRDGDFLLDIPDKYSFRMRVQSLDGAGTESSASADTFFVRAMNGLLEILRNTLFTDAIPHTVLELEKAIVDELRGYPTQFEACPYFLGCRWLFSSYLPSLIGHPESYGILLTHHISSSARKNILNEIAMRLQKLSFDVAYTWKHTAPVEASLLDNIHAVFALLRPESLKKDSNPDMSPPEPDPYEHVDTVTLCPSDVLTLVDGLFPMSAIDLGLSGMRFGGSTVHSSASSVSGYSISRHHSRQDGSVVGSPATTSADWTETERIHEPLFKAEDDLLITQLRALCNDLTATYGGGPSSSYRDPFSEPWASVTVTGRLSTQMDDLNARHSLDLTDMRLQDDATEAVESGIIPAHLGKAIYFILDHVIDTSKGHEGRVLKPHDLHPSHTAGALEGHTDFLTALLSTFREAALDCRKRGHFAKAQSHHLASKQIRAILQSDPAGSDLRRFFHCLAREAESSVEIDEAAVKSLESQADAFQMNKESQRVQIRAITERIWRLREKIWYSSSVRFAGHYEELSRVTSALKTMSLPRKVVPEKVPSLRHRPTISRLHESAILDLLAAPPNHGGPNKLSDQQIKLTSQWLSSKGIENICKGEERFHRFCQEISRCVDFLVGDSVVEHPVLWSSDLFKDQQPSFRQNRANLANAPTLSSARERLQAMYESRQRHETASNQSRGRPTASSPLFGSSHGPTYDAGRRTSFGFSGSCSPTLTSSTSDTIWSSFTAGNQTISSATSLPSHTLSRPLSDRSSYGSLGGHRCDQAFLDELRHNVTSLLLSDLGQVFHGGSETDMSLWRASGGKFADRVSCAIFDRAPWPGTVPQVAQHMPAFDQGLPGRIEQDERTNEPSTFDPLSTFRDLFHKFELVSSPFEKLKILCQVQDIYQFSLESSDWMVEEDKSTTPPTRIDAKGHHPDLQSGLSEPLNATNDTLVAGFRRLLRDRTICPTTLFRDLQYIASLVPTTILDNNTLEGRAFWNATIAALSIKQDIVDATIETADAIIAYHTMTRCGPHSIVASPAQAERDSATFTTSRPGSAAASENISHYSMGDAAELYLVAAREGEPVAMRELATLWLTHPEIMRRCIAPMSLAGDVFKGDAAEALRAEALRGRKGGGFGYGYGGGWDGGVGGGLGDRSGGSGTSGAEYRRQQRDQHGEPSVADAKYDPVAMAIARHWMELAAKGGDLLAKNTLKATDEIERIP